MLKAITSLDKAPDFSSAMKLSMSIAKAKEHADHVQGFIKSVLHKFHDFKGIEEVGEFELLSDAKGLLCAELGCEVEVIDAQSSNLEKAKKAFPLKPAILVE